MIVYIIIIIIIIIIISLLLLLLLLLLSLLLLLLLLLLYLWKVVQYWDPLSIALSHTVGKITSFQRPGKEAFVYSFRKKI